MSEDETQQLARQMLKLHGDAAIDVVIQQIDDAADLGDDGAVLLWAQVFNVLNEWERSRTKLH
jgi:hypothetical protein